MVRRAAILALIGLAIPLFPCAGTKSAAAISVDLARKCRVLALRAHPYRAPGEPGGGSAQAEREYFSGCVARKGSMPPDSTDTNQSKAAPDRSK
jgi:hypothetical protein